MKTEPTPVMAGDGGVYVVTLMKASSSNYRQPARAAPGEILRSPDRTMAAMRCRVPYWGHRLWSGAGWKGREVVWRAFSRVDNGGSQRHGAAGSRRGHVMMDERRMVALSGIVVASTIARPGKVDAGVHH